MRTRTVQNLLLAVGVVALLFLLLEIGITLAATQHGSTPARIDEVVVGPYHFKVSLYENPARAGFALPFAIAPQGSVNGSWTYHVISLPEGRTLNNGEVLADGQFAATPIQDSVSPDPHTSGGVQGVAEITVQGSWNLQVVVDGPAGQQTFNVAITAVTLPAIPIWLGWALGFIPVYGIVVFLVMLRRQKGQSVQSAPLPQ